MISALATAVIPALLLPWTLFLAPMPILFAVLPVIPVAIVYVRAIAARDAGRAVTLALAWAAAFSVSTIAAATARPDAAVHGIWHAGEFRDEMVRWIATGVGPEGDIRLFLPRVLLEFALVLALSAATAGVAGLLLGAALLGYMNGYVGWVASNADARVGPLAAALIAWPPWSAARVVAFVCAGTAAALWGYPRLLARGAPRGRWVRLLIVAVLLLGLDIFLKWWLAPIWRDWLRSILGASAGIEAGGSA
ncbi:MAG TPA: hypothetical protein VE326_07775 [Candidatus Binatia bacterium]|nr:hypothetical protein [Candidatus Binatia bacterium]